MLSSTKIFYMWQPATGNSGQPVSPTQQLMIWGKLTAILTHQVAENIS
jgi:hypothetical protein